MRTADTWRKESKLYREASIFQTAARMWAQGVPWAKALRLATETLQKLEPSKGKGKGKGKVGGKRKSKD